MPGEQVPLFLGAFGFIGIPGEPEAEATAWLTSVCHHAMPV